MKKLKLVGMGNDVRRSYFIFKKDNSFFSLFPLFLEELGLEKLGILYEHDEESQDLDSVIDIQDTTRNREFDLDIFYGTENCIVVIRTDEINRTRLINAIKKIADYPGF